MRMSDKQWQFFKTLYPRIRRFHAHNQNIVKVKCEKTMKNVSRRIQWCKFVIGDEFDKWYYTKKTFFFSEESDAMLYKLTWMNISKNDK